MGAIQSNISQFLGVVEDIDERMIVSNEARVNIDASMGANEEATSEQAKEGEASETMLACDTLSETVSKFSSTLTSYQETTLPAPNANVPAAATSAVVGQTSDTYPVNNMFGSS